MEIADMVIAGLKSLPKDPRINELLAEAMKVAEFPDIKTVDDLVAELTAEEKPMPRPNSRMPIMVGGARNKAQLFLAAVILLYVLTVYGLVRMDLFGFREFLTAAGGLVFIPMLIRIADRLFIERRLFVAEPLAYNATEQSIRYPLHVVRLEFKPSDGTLNYVFNSGSRVFVYSTIVEPINDMYGELPTLPGALLFSIQNSYYKHSRNPSEVNRALPKLVDGVLQIPPVGFLDMALQKSLYGTRYNYLEEILYFNNSVIAYAHGNPPAPQRNELLLRYHNRALEYAAGAAFRPELELPENQHLRNQVETIQVLEGARNTVFLDDLVNDDIIISFRYGNGGRIYNKETHTGDIVLLSSYNKNPDKIKHNQGQIDLASRRVYRVKLVPEITEEPQIGGRRRRRRRRRTLKHRK